ncbi:hypothetical protein MUK42_05045 [Musa troglodytarum]|uniref:Uncharacterized protein n=1 Tax=Musa troglodytarum TaxID=320322 RepID=A0A9E7KEM7_9LILI|nr:hypothetical protein MUK42_05045 [Musa troglodytarum]
MDHSVQVTQLHDLDDRPGHGRGRPFRIVPPRHDPIEELPALTELHHQVNGAVVLPRLSQGHNAGALREVAHDGHLPPHVLDVHRRPELALRDRLARKQLPSVPVHAEVGDAELATAKLTIEYILLLDPAGRPHAAAEDGQPLGVAAGGPPTAPAVEIVLAGGGLVVEVGADVLSGDGRRRTAAVAHCLAGSGKGFAPAPPSQKARKKTARVLIRSHIMDAEQREESKASFQEWNLNLKEKRKKKGKERR